MRSPASLLFSFVIAIAIFGASEKSFAEPYLFEVLAKPTYLKTWNALFTHEKDIDSWLLTYAITKDAVASPGTTIQLSGVDYQINTICKPHECGDNRFFVLFSPDGMKAWGLLIDEGGAERFFGGPDKAKKKALRATAHK